MVPFWKHSQNGPRDGEQVGGCQGTGWGWGVGQGGSFKESSSMSRMKRLCILIRAVVTEIRSRETATWDPPTAPHTHAHIEKWGALYKVCKVWFPATHHVGVQVLNLNCTLVKTLS